MSTATGTLRLPRAGGAIEPYTPAAPSPFMPGRRCDRPAGIRAAVEAAGYDGPIEVEVINRDAWKRPGDEVIATVCDRFVTAS